MSIFKDLLFMQGYLTDDRFFDPPAPVAAPEAQAPARDWPKPLLAAQARAASACTQGACCA
ncbi:hypothetical protein [Lysobacter silvisoli]|uniref:Uncharacterized protein n=1 Tax=Lysobacter silvisoli TaxID=2293254 RepID=A0A371JY20_9GAMM|nr:hypothetical protein [Lysobacter silvisoli]RDZ26530.1 hypothetical protein DX914_16205 [Lysobacter silvisoli]